MYIQNAADNNKPPEYVAEITNMSCNPIYIIIYILFTATKITDLMKKKEKSIKIFKIREKFIPTYLPLHVRVTRGTRT